MIYELLFPLHLNPSLGFLNVLRYVPFRVVMAMLTAVFFFFVDWLIRIGLQGILGMF